MKEAALRLCQSALAALCCLFACPGLHAEGDAELPLQVARIAHDDAYRQLSFHFNQDVALPGEVPSLAQVDAVSISQDVKRQCAWRFPSLNTLACELRVSLSPLAAYEARIDTRFHALGKQLEAAATLVIRPQLDPTAHHQLFLPRDQAGLGNFPDRISLSRLRLGLPFDLWSRALRLRLPDQTERRVSAKASATQDTDAFATEVDVQLDGITGPLPEGEYQLLLAKRHWPARAASRLEEDLRLASFWHSPEFKFLGLGCRVQWPHEARMVELDAQGQLPCPPEEAAFAFSAKPSRARDTESPDGRQRLPWLGGGGHDADHWSSHNADNRHYVFAQLEGDTAYTLELGKARARDGRPLANPGTLRFTTQAATPLWRLAPRTLGTVVELDDDAEPALLRRNVPELRVQATPIQTPAELLAHLRSPAPSAPQSLAQTEATRRALRRQRLPVRELLNSKSGLVALSVSGTHHAYGGAEGKEERTESMTAGVAAFNLMVWPGQNLLVQAVSWGGAPVAGAEAQLVCPSFQQPAALGQTDEDGFLWLQPGDWQPPPYPDLSAKDPDCWIWAEKRSQHAAIPIHAAWLAKGPPFAAFIWTAQPIYQPGDRIHIGLNARTRDASGPLHVANMEGYSLQLVAPSDRQPQDFQQLPLAAPSRYGFIHVEHQLAPTDELGFYHLQLWRKAGVVPVAQASFWVLEHEPPAFEVSVRYPTRLARGDRLKVALAARRMNGLPLLNGKATVSYQLRQLFTAPSHWPLGYSYLIAGADDDEASHSASPRTLDAEGQLDYQGPRLHAQTPLGKLETVTEVVAESGESRSRDKSIPYFGRAHYLGTRYDETRQALEIIAVDPLGEQVTDVAVSVTAANDGDWRPNLPHATCEAKELPFFCPLPRASQRLKIAIVSKPGGYAWETSLAPSSRVPRQGAPAFRLKLESPKESVLPGESLTLTLQSPLAGRASLILDAGGVRKVWQQDLVAGANAIPLVADASWRPWAQVDALLHPKRTEAIAAFTAALKAGQTPLFGYYRRHDSYRDNNRRILIDSVRLPAKGRKPKVQLRAPQRVLSPGGLLSLSVVSDQAADSQLWLVNDALLQLMDVDLASYDFAAAMELHLGLQGAVSLALSDSLVFDSLHDWRDMPVPPFSPADPLGSGQADADRLRGGLRLPAQLRAPADKALPFSQSLWLDTLELAADVPQEVVVTLPQLIGRWRVIAITATKDDASLNHLQVTTTRELEYFLDAPVALFAQDRGSFGVTQINPGSRRLADTLEAGAGDAPPVKLELSLGPGAQTYASFPLPSLPPGEHDLLLRSQRLPGFIARQTLKVLPEDHASSRAYLLRAGAEGRLVLPAAQARQVSLTAQAAGGDAPFWPLLTDYIRGYPHACWEQLLSNAVSYAFNPQASSDWPEGQAAMEKALAQESRFVSDGLYAYFPRTGDGAGGSFSDQVFLSAYTYLAFAWLDSRHALPPGDRRRLRRRLLDLAAGSGGSIEARSMALLALAENGDLELEQARELRQQMGRGERFSAVLQLLALQRLGAERQAWRAELQGLLEGGYQDAYASILSRTSHQCFLALALEEGDAERQALLRELALKQQGQGHFGSTFANAVCSYVFRDAKAPPPALAIPHRQAGQELRFDAAAIAGDYWLRVDYQQPLAAVEPAANGISVERRLQVKRGKRWRSVKGKPLALGELVRVEVQVDTPIAREHVAVTDSIPGGLEAIHPRLGPRLYNEGLGASWPSGGHLEIKEGKASWFIRRLRAGRHTLAYYARARHPGDYALGPARAEAMYRPDVWGNTRAGSVKVAR